MDLTEFLLGRIAEDEAAALAAGNFKAYRDDMRRYYLDRDGGERVTFSADSQAEVDWWTHAVKHLPGRVLAECEAKRRILRVHPMMLNADDSVRACSTCGGDGVCATVKALALPYADHPDYREEWKP